MNWNSFLPLLELESCCEWISIQHLPSFNLSKNHLEPIPLQEMDFLKKIDRFALFSSISQKLVKNLGYFF